MTYRVVLLQIVLALVSGCITSSGPDTAGWHQAGLSGTQINTIQAKDGMLYVGTDRGLYRSPAPQISWESLGVNEASVRTVAVFSEQKLLAPVNFGDGDSLTIAKTTDGGRNWFPFRNGFGGGSRIIPLALEIHPDNDEILFARGAYNVVRSTNQGKSWESVFLTWDHIGTSRFVKIDKNNPDIIWAGGANAIFQPILVKSEDGGDSWKRIDIFKGLDVNPFEATVFDIAIHPDVSSKILIGMGGVLRTDDYGDTLEVVSTETSIRALTNSPSENETLYATGIHPSSKLAMSITLDFGDTWEMLIYKEGPDEVIVNDLVVVEVEGREVLYFATNQGVYSYTFED